ncbi:uncharacterized protein [Anabrus simplex]|uniref:uncharacterized protein n=1 Tax=Anabrus simplex TaxID=316456 RepID=UPI0035A2CA0C
MRFTMGMEPVIAWVVVRRYDQLDAEGREEVSNTPPMIIPLKPNSNFNELKIQIRDWLGLAENGNEIIKLRRSDEALITLSCLLGGSSEEKPYFLDIARIHQNSPASPRLAMSPTYIETVRSKLNNLEKRVERVESLVPEFRSQRLANIDRTLQQLGSKVNFLDKRLDELVPLEWKAHFHQSPTSP